MKECFFKFNNAYIIKQVVNEKMCGYFLVLTDDQYKAELERGVLTIHELVSKNGDTVHVVEVHPHYSCILPGVESLESLESKFLYNKNYTMKCYVSFIELDEMTFTKLYFEVD